MIEQSPANLDKCELELVSQKGLSKEEIRDFIARVEDKMKDGIPIEILPSHHFSKAVYAREIRIPKGTLISGHIHKFQNMTIICKGLVSVLSIDGFKKLQAGDIMVSSPGVKRLIYAHEDTIWTTVHGTEETNIEKLEKELVAKNYDELPDELKSMEEKLCLS